MTVVPSGAPPGRQPVTYAVDLLVGATSLAADGVVALARPAVAVARPLVRVVLYPPLVPPVGQPGRWLRALALRGSDRRELARRDVELLLDRVVPAVVVEVLARVDLTAVIKEHVEIDALVAEVDLDSVAGRLDVDAVARRLDVDAVIDRVDLIARAQAVIAAIDLPEIIRESTGSMASETVRDVRMQGIVADEAVGRIVDRLLRRGRRAGGDAVSPTAVPPEAVAERPDVPTARGSDERSDDR